MKKFIFCVEDSNGRLVSATEIFAHNYKKAWDNYRDGGNYCYGYYHNITSYRSVNEAYESMVE